MNMKDRSILRDCLETEKHLAMIYQWASFECDSDGLRKALQDISVDKNDLRNAVFNLMHQMGLYENKAADAAMLASNQKKWEQALAGMKPNQNHA